MKIEWNYSAKYKKKNNLQLKFNTSYLGIQYPTEKENDCPWEPYQWLETSDGRNASQEVL